MDWELKKNPEGPRIEEKTDKFVNVTVCGDQKPGWLG